MGGGKEREWAIKGRSADLAPVAREWGTRLGGPVNWKVARIEGWEAVPADFPGQGTLLGLIPTDEPRFPAVFILERRLALVIVERLLGGVWEASPTHGGLSGLDLSLMEQALFPFIGEFLRTEKALSPVDWVTPEQGGESAFYALGAGPLVRIEWESQWGAQQFPLSLVVPAALVDTWIAPVPGVALPPEQEQKWKELGEEVARLKAELGELKKGEALGGSSPLGPRKERSPAMKKLVRQMASHPHQVGWALMTLAHEGKTALAALALVRLGSPIAAKLLAKLPPMEIESLVFEMSRLESATQEELDHALATLGGYAFPRDYWGAGAIDYVRDVLERALGTKGAVEMINRLTDALLVKPFEILGQLKPSELHQVLCPERPQTVALVLSFLDPQVAAPIWELFPQEEKANLAGRMASLGPVLPSVVRAVERFMEARLGSEEKQGLMEAGGVAQVAELLRLANAETRTGVLTSLEKTDPKVAQALKG